jgi:hypothetical protein
MAANKISEKACSEKLVVSISPVNVIGKKRSLRPKNAGHSHHRNASADLVAEQNITPCFYQSLCLLSHFEIH